MFTLSKFQCFKIHHIPNVFEGWSVWNPLHFHTFKRLPQYDVHYSGSVKDEVKKLKCLKVWSVNSLEWGKSPVWAQTSKHFSNLKEKNTLTCSVVASPFRHQAAIQHDGGPPWPARWAAVGGPPSCWVAAWWRRGDLKEENMGVAAFLQCAI